MQQDPIFAPFGNAPMNAPFVVGQLGQSIDGRIATASGDACYIGGKAALDHLHAIRAHVDAVVVGASTQIADDPQLTVRRVPGKNPARVVIDPRGRTRGGRWLAEDGARRILITAKHDIDRPCDEIILAEAPQGRIAPAFIVQALFERGLRRILIEGGARTLASFIEAGCLDRLHVVVSPLIIGSGKPAFELKEIARLDEAMRPPVEIHLLGGGEVLFDFQMKQAQLLPQTGSVP